MQCQEQLGNTAPDVDDASLLKRFVNLMQQSDVRSRVLAYHDRSDGGLMATLSEMVFASRIGVDILLPDDVDPVAYLFNEELGAVIQVSANDRDEVIKSFTEADVPIHKIATESDNENITISQGVNTLTTCERADLQRRWSATSYHIQSLRDNPQCAEEEYARISDDNDPGLSVELTFDINEDIAAPMIATGAKPRIAILREQGVNSQVEMAAAFTRAGFSAIDIHMSEILTGNVTLADYKGLVACGGFSYGDVLGAGEGWAKSILFHAQARDVFSAFFNREDTFGLGVCNGCQMFASLKSLIPGADAWPKFVTNRSEQFEARFSLVKILSNPSILLTDMAGSHMPIAVSHGEGRADFSEAHATALMKSEQVAFQFVDHYLDATETYPMNPNGSPLGVAAVTTPDGRFTAMMPHPERVYRTSQNSWHPADWQEDSPWMRIFRNARVFVE